jgi:hypothetical protein
MSRDIGARAIVLMAPSDRKTHDRMLAWAKTMNGVIDTGCPELSAPFFYMPNQPRHAYTYSNDTGRSYGGVAEDITMFNMMAKLPTINIPND